MHFELEQWNEHTRTCACIRTTQFLVLCFTPRELFLYFKEPVWMLLELSVARLSGDLRGKGVCYLLEEG